ncbi:hypothetical protein SAMN04487758_1055 [Enterococcus mundtii]|nr:hypothetical protein SAMN04487758_1055 [Enterococcus mundtii]
MSSLNLLMEQMSARVGSQFVVKKSKRAIIVCLDGFFIEAILFTFTSAWSCNRFRDRRSLHGIADVVIDGIFFHPTT